MVKPAFIWADLSDVKVIMAIMRVLVEELLCQTVMGWTPILEYLLSGACGCLWLRLIMPGIKCHRFPRIQLQRHLPDTGEPPRVSAAGLGVCRARP
jgi:hypothetical protein